MPKKIYIDLETTGLDPQKNGVIQIAGMIEPGEGVPSVEFDYNVRPWGNDAVEESALAVNGKTILEVMNYPQATGVYLQFTALLKKYVKSYDKTDKLHFVGYNAKFDADALRAWFLKCGDKYFGSYFWHPPIDIMAIAGWVLQDERHTMENFKLGTVAKHLGIALPENMHDAFADITVTKEIEIRLQERISVMSLIGE